MDIEILYKIITGLLGVLFLTAFNAKDYIFKSGLTFSWSKHISENYSRWLWAMIMVTIIAVVTQMEPETGKGIKAFTGLDIEGTRAAYFSLGLALTAMIKKKTI